MRVCVRVCVCVCVCVCVSVYVCVCVFGAHIYPRACVSIVNPSVLFDDVVCVHDDSASTLNCCCACLTVTARSRTSSMGSFGNVHNAGDRAGMMLHMDKVVKTTIAVETASAIGFMYVVLLRPMFHCGGAIGLVCVVRVSSPR